LRWSNVLSVTFLHRSDLDLDILPFFVTPVQGMSWGLFDDDPLGTIWDRGHTYQDVNSDGIIDSTEVIPDATTIQVGNTEPSRTLGFISTVRLGRHLAFGVQLDGQSGHVRYDRSELTRCASFLCRGLHDPDASLAEQARAVARRHRSRSGGFVEDASFVKLRELWVRLSLPGAASVMRASELTVVVSARNLLTWTDYSGEDPETVSFFGPSFRAGDRFGQPHLRSVAIRLELVW